MKLTTRERKKLRIRGKLKKVSNLERYRLSVSRSAKNISAQIIDDTKNISARLREGYELVRKDEYPDFEAPVVESGKYEGVIGTGGLLLARIPLETVEERRQYFAGKSHDQMQAVDYDMMRENAHSTMTIAKPDRQSRVTFGGTTK